MPSVNKFDYTWKRMHSNFITPPDFVPNILIIDASADEIEAVAEHCKDSQESYNVYMYRKDMNDYNWLSQVFKRVDQILIQQDSDVPVLDAVKFGPDQILKSPADYFNK
jgi:hypothetical protein